MDLVNAGIVGLFKALKSYNGSIPEPYWIFRIVKTEIIKARYKHGKEHKEITGYDEFFKNSLEATEDYNPLNIIYKKEHEQEQKQKLKQIYKILNSKMLILTKNNNMNRNIYVDKQLNGLSTREIAYKYGITEEGISKRISKVNLLIRAELRQKGIIK
jgi:RNA polymerase sigma factor (sigma-70 family)